MTQYSQKQRDNQLEGVNKDALKQQQLPSLNPKFYIPHFFYYRNAPKIIKLIMQHGLIGYAIYWIIMEMLGENDGYLNINDSDIIVYETRASKEMIDDIIKNFDLFVIKDDLFFSPEIIENIKIRRDKSKKSSRAAKIRHNTWDADKDDDETKEENDDTDPSKAEGQPDHKIQNNENGVMRTHCERTASAMQVKERKDKISKSISKERVKKKNELWLTQNVCISSFDNVKSKMESFMNCADEEGKLLNCTSNVIEKFKSYWTQIIEPSIMLFESQTAFDMKKRIQKWIKDERSTEKPVDELSEYSKLLQNKLKIQKDENKN
jgi:hypothetical protein